MDVETKIALQVDKIHPECYDLFSLGNCLLNLFENDPKIFTRENLQLTKREIDVTHLIGKKRKIRAVKNIEIQRVAPKKRRKMDKTDKSQNSKKDRRKENEMVLEHNSAFSLIMPYLLTTELKFEFNE